MINENWPRWTRASLTKWFKSQITPDLDFHMEGADRRTDSKRAYCEFRLDGPIIRELSKDYFRLDIDVNILIVTKTDDKDLYAHERNVGIALRGFVKGISVWKLGDGADDQPLETIGCLEKTPYQDGQVVISNFGQIAPENRLVRSSIEATYRLQLKSE